MANRGKKLLTKAVRATLAEKSDRRNLVPSLLGAYRNGLKTIIVADQPDFVWVRLRGNQDEVVKAFNEKVGLHFDLPILVYRDEEMEDLWSVHGRDIRQYPSWEGSYYGVAHGLTHSMAGAVGTGSDIVWAMKRQIVPMLPRPEPTGTMGMYIESDFYFFDGRYHYWGGSGTGDIFSAQKPTGAMNARYVTVYIDSIGNPAALAGPEFDKVYPGDPTDYIPLPDPDDGVVIAAVRLMTGTAYIGWYEIYDLRNPQSPPYPTGLPIWIADENVEIGKAYGLNFIGDGVHAVISGTYAHIMHTGTTGVGVGSQHFHVGVPTATEGGTGHCWKVPESEFATGSLAVAVDGIVQEPGVDYNESYPGSGTFCFTESPDVGSRKVCWYGIYCT